MIEINLIPEELKKKLRKRKKDFLPKIPFMSVFLGITGLFVGFYLLIAVFVIIEKNLLKSLNYKWNSIAEAKKEVDFVKDGIAKIKNKALSFNKLLETRILWAERLNQISDSMISGVWLKKIALGEKVIVQSKEQQAGEKKKPEEKKIIKYLIIEGSVIAKGQEETAIVARFIKSLKSNEAFFNDFRDIELNSIQRSKQDESDIANFEIFCYFK